MNKNTQGWKLSALNIAYQEWGDYKGKYTGKVKFQNASDEIFMFNLSPEETGQFLDLVSVKLAKAGVELGHQLMDSLGLLPAPATETPITEHENVTT